MPSMLMCLLYCLTLTHSLIGYFYASIYPSEGRPAQHLSAPSAPLFSRLRRSLLGAFGASVAFETVPHASKAPGHAPGSRVSGPCRCLSPASTQSSLRTGRQLRTPALDGPCGLSKSGPFYTAFRIFTH